MEGTGISFFLRKGRGREVKKKKIQFPGDWEKTGSGKKG